MSHNNRIVKEKRGQVGFQCIINLGGNCFPPRFFSLKGLGFPWMMYHLRNSEPAVPMKQPPPPPPPPAAPPSACFVNDKKLPQLQVKLPSSATHFPVKVPDPAVLDERVKVVVSVTIPGSPDGLGWEKVSIEL